MKEANTLREIDRSTMDDAQNKQNSERGDRTHTKRPYAHICMNRNGQTRQMGGEVRGELIITYY